MVFYYLVRADGYTKLATIALALGAVTNILLDALLVAYLEYGIKGAAYATAAAQIVQLSVLLLYLGDKNRAITFSTFNKPWRRVFRAVKNGLSEFTNEISVGVLFLVIKGTLLISKGNLLISLVP